MGSLETNLHTGQLSQASLLFFTTFLYIASQEALRFENHGTWRRFLFRKRDIGKYRLVFDALRP
jgi:hypothetical protein